MLDTTRPLDDRDRWFVGTWLRVLAGADDTGGQLTVMEQRAPRGFSPPLHVHDREDTALVVLAGALTVQVGDGAQTIGPGGVAWLPRGVAHTFRVDSDEVHLLELATPGGVEGFHVVASEPASEPALPPAGPPDVPRLAAASAPFAVSIIGPPLPAPVARPLPTSDRTCPPPMTSVQGSTG
jgi:quercetin dioxygenase-like cupin family protein